VDHLDVVGQWNFLSSIETSNKEMSRKVDPITVPCQWLRLFWVVLMLLLNVALPVAASTTTHNPEEYSYWQVLALVNAPALPGVVFCIVLLWDTRSPSESED
jgi:ABC-type microcin C transport system permease subunit YejB